MQVLRFLCCVLFILEIRGHANCLISEKYPGCSGAGCDVPLQKGELMMNSPVTAASSYSILVKRGTKTVNQKGFYVPGENLDISISPSNPTMEFVIETSGAIFENGGCFGRRVVSNNRNTLIQSLKLPLSGQVSIWAGWAAKYGTVSITEQFILFSSSGTSNTSQNELVLSGPLPLTLGDQVSPEDEVSPVQNLIISLSFGSCVAIAIFMLAVVIRNKFKSFDVQSSQVLAYFPKAPVIAITFSVITVILVCLWGQDKNSSKQMNYLGKPHWDTNVFAWHPVLMVGGFFFSQVLAICSWSVIPHHGFAKFVHIVFQTSSVITVLVGLSAIIRFKSQNPTPSLTTMHSWVGVGTIVLCLINYMWGSCMALVTHFKLTTNVNLRSVHKCIGLAVFGFSAVSILTGINDQLSQGMCDYSNASTQYVSGTLARNFEGIPTACKIANGLGVVVLLATVLVFIVVSNRKHSAPQNENPVALEIQNVP